MQPPIPSLIKSCSYCRSKKVRCLGELPICSKCAKSDTKCNVSDCVFYTHTTVKVLTDRIAQLEQELFELKSKNNLSNTSPNGPKQEASIHQQIPSQSQVHQQQQQQQQQLQLQSQAQPQPQIQPQSQPLPHIPSTSLSQSQPQSQSPQTQQQQSQNTLPSPKQYPPLDNSQPRSVSSLPNSSPSQNSTQSVRSTGSSSNEFNKGASPEPSLDQVIDSISTEVGSLTITNTKDQSNGKYIGAATGSNFIKTFLKLINLNRIGDVSIKLENEFATFDSTVTKTYASLPSYKEATYLLLKYIDNTQIYYPIIVISALKTAFNNIYQNPTTVTNFDKYLIFIVLAIASLDSQRDPMYKSFASIYTPDEYFNTASRYFETMLSNRSESALQALLLMIIWMTKSNALNDDGGDLWYMGRFAMSLAMELGVHRYNPDWNFGEARNELRNRLFWTCYSLERMIAMKFGRGLSLRNPAIDTPFPTLTEDDNITDPNEIALLPTYHRVQFVPGIMLIKIREIGGDMLESVYISRTKGARPTISDDDCLQILNNLRKRLESWLDMVEREIPHDSCVYYELRVQYCVTSMILNRPNPSFPSPDIDSIRLCKQNCDEGTAAYLTLVNRGWCITPNCLHDLVTIGLARLYCSWRLDSDSSDLRHFCSSLSQLMLQACVSFPKFNRFMKLFELISTGIIDHLDRSYMQQQQQQQQQMHHQQHQRQQHQQQVQQHHQQLNSLTPLGFEWNEWFAQEVFDDGFKQYYDLSSGRLINELSEPIFGFNFPN